MVKSRESAPRLNDYIPIVNKKISLQPINNTLLARHTTAHMRGTAFGIYFFSAFAIGSLASSYSGFVAQMFGLQWVFLGLSGSAFLLIFFAFLLLRIRESNGPSHP